MPTLPPTYGSGSQTTHRLRNSDKFGKEFVADRVKRPLFYLPNFVAAADLVSMGAGTADLDEVNATELGGIQCATTESYSTLWVLPDEIDLAQPIDIRVLTCDEAAASGDTQTAVVTYQAVTVGTDALVAPATALNTLIVAQADLAADIPWWTTWGTINGGTITDIPGEDLCNIKILWTLSTLGAIWTLSAQVRYYRKFVG
jgi:hypothetical protein